MSLANIFAGIGGAYTAIQKGMDDAQFRKDKDQERQWRNEDRQRAKVDQDFQDEQRGIWRRERQRADQENERLDALATESAANFARLTTGLSQSPEPTASAPATSPAPFTAPQAASAPAQPAADVVTPPAAELGDRGVATVTPGAAPADSSQATQAPTDAAAPKTLPKRYTYGQFLRDQAASLAKARKYDDASKYLETAGKWDLDQASKRLTALIGSADGMSLEDYAGQAAKLFNDDPLPQSVTAVKPNNDGTVSVTIRHRDSDQTATRTFKDKNALTSALQSFYQPDVFASNQQAANKARLEAETKIAENPIQNVPGGYYDKKSGKFVPTMVGGDITGYTEDGKPIYSSRGPAGSASGKSSKPTGPGSPYQEHVDDLAKVAETKFASVDEANAVKVTVDKFAQAAGYDTKKLPPPVAAQVALNYVRAGGVKAEKVGIDPVTGLPRREFHDPEYGVFGVGAMAPNSPQQSEVLKAVPQMLEVQGLDAAGKPQERLVKKDDGSVVATPQTMDDVTAYQKRLRAAAFDRSGANGTSVVRQQLEAEIKEQVALSAEQAIAKYPDRADQIRAAIPTQTNQQLAVLGRKLDLIAKGMKPEKKDEKAEPAKTLSQRLQESGSGLPRALREDSQSVARERDATAAAKRLELEKQSKDAQDKAVESKRLKEEAAAIPAEAISRSNSLDELSQVARKYDRFMDGRQRDALYRRMEFLRRQASMPQPQR